MTSAFWQTLWHVPLLQVLPFGQTTSQAPQFHRSVRKLTQLPSQSKSCEEQFPRHWPLRQTWLVLQASPQPPQLAKSLLVFTQTPAHSVSCHGH